MHERLLEDWLRKIGERGFEVPFAQTLLSRGYRILRIGHSPIEHGKDVIARASDGQLHAYQLKSGPLDIKGWEEIYPQIVALVESGIEHPNVGDESWQAWLVISGDFSTPVLNRIATHNKTWKRRGFSGLQIISGKDLLTDISAISTDFWPVELPNLQCFLELYQKVGTAFIDKAAYAKFCYNLIKSGGKKKSEISRRLSALNIFISYLLSKAYAAENHWAIIEGWTIASSHIAWAALKFKLREADWLASFEIAQHATLRALEALHDEAMADHALTPQTVEWDEITRARSTYAAGAVAVWQLIQGERADAQQSQRAYSLISNLVGARRTLLWSESAVPFFVAMILFLGNAGTSRLDDTLLLSLIDSIAQANGRRSGFGLADPYDDGDVVLERTLRRLTKPVKRPRMHVGMAYTLEGLIFLATRRLLRTHLDMLWPAITYVDFVKFVPYNRYDYLLWHVDDGSLDSRQPGRPQSWSGLLNAARQRDYKDFLSETVIERPTFALLLSLVFPQRLTTELIMFLDDSFRLSFGSIKSH